MLSVDLYAKVPVTIHSYGTFSLPPPPQKKH